MEGVTTPEAIPEEDAAIAPESGSEGADLTGSISLDALKETLGKDFKDVDGALKSLKDTYSYVGSQAQYTEKISALAETLGTDEAGVLSTLENLMEGLKPEAAPVDATPDTEPVDNEGFITREQYAEDTFFAANPDIAEMKDILGPLKEAHGADQSWSDFVASERAQSVITPLKGYREMEAQKSVLDPNSRIGQATDKVTDAQKKQQESRTLAAQGDVTGANRADGEAKEAATASVIEAFGLK
jgi:hypothetical protein